MMMVVDSAYKGAKSSTKRVQLIFIVNGNTQ